MKGTAERAEKFPGIVSRERVTDSSGKPFWFLLRAPLGNLRSSLPTLHRSRFPPLGSDHIPSPGEHCKSVLAPAALHQGQGKVLARHR